MTPQELKESLLWNAIQGKITAQSADESVAEVIGMLQVSPVAEDECYFDIPSNWKWVRIGDVFDLVNGKAFKPSDWSDTGIPIVRIQNLNDNTAPYNYCSIPCESKYYIHGGELLFSWSGTPGTSFGAFIWNGGEAVLNQHIFIVYPKIQADTMYLMYALNAELRIFIEKAHGGAGLKHITRKEFDACLLPIPPLAEQQRIAAKIEELLPLIDRYEKAWNRLEEFNKQFPGDLQKSILQMAIQGKLVEQRPEEGTGEELYQQIQAEKKKLIAEGKIKKEKPLPEITEEEKPFDIPDNWKWVKLGAVVTVLGGKRIPAGRKLSIEDTGHVYIRVSDMKKSSVVMDNLQYVPVDIYPSISRYIINKEDVYITVAGTIGTVGTIPAILDGANLTENADRLVFSNLDQAWLVRCLQSVVVQNQILDATTKVGQPKLAIVRIQNMIVPLPPIAEQKRIVARLEELLAICKRLMI